MKEFVQSNFSRWAQTFRHSHVRRLVADVRCFSDVRRLQIVAGYGIPKATFFSARSYGRYGYQSNGYMNPQSKGHDDLCTAARSPQAGWRN